MEIQVLGIKRKITPQDSRSGPALGQRPKPGLARLRPPPTTPGSLGSIGPTMEHFFPCQGFSLLFVGAQASSPSQAHPETLLSPSFLPHTPQGQPLFPVWDTYGAKRTEVKSPVAHPPLKTTGLGAPPSLQCLAQVSGGLRPLVELCVEPAGLCGRCTGVAVPLRTVTVALALVLLSLPELG